MLLSFVLYILYEFDIVFLKLFTCFDNLCMSLPSSWFCLGRAGAGVPGRSGQYIFVPRLGGVGVSKGALCLKDWPKLHLCLLLEIDGMASTKSPSPFRASFHKGSIRNHRHDLRNEHQRAVSIWD